MSRSKKDGRRRGAHIDHQNTEVWSKRCAKVSMMPKASNGHAPRGGHGYKTLTHRYERRVAEREIRRDLYDMDDGGKD